MVPEQSPASSSSSSSSARSSASLLQRFFTSHGLPRLSWLMTAAQLLPHTELKKAFQQALSALREPAVRRRPLQSAWSSLYSDALLSCFEYLELRDLAATYFRLSRLGCLPSHWSTSEEGHGGGCGTRAA